MSGQTSVDVAADSTGTIVALTPVTEVVPGVTVVVAGVTSVFAPVAVEVPSKGQDPAEPVLSSFRTQRS